MAETTPGGRYVVSGVLVDAHGRPIPADPPAEASPLPFEPAPTPASRPRRRRGGTAEGA